ncbi:NAD(P)/FAD-dependent oxidoreductase [Streptomyces marispadix]|uniref:FAD-dependent oxidoreductase n=1 Tax=Streptomyces marispadix TaxID=2922868 RepID=A0ABS9SV49_9ACTN|nr:FAD-dependent oxidoreductase [Streptomyces marispadix]MCH6160158.1 FAD-dependent oxidoreductase [Streptomyces marispadix]
MDLRSARQRVVVIGGGMAGARLAQALGAAGAAPGAGAAVDLTVVGEESHAPYNRVLLADVLAGRYAPDVVALPASRARWLRGVRAVRIDRAERRVVCDDGGVLPYDTLVLATGANPVLPPLRGLFTPGGGELPDGVRAFRTMDDCLALHAEVRPGIPAVVVGGGLLGVSAARALARRGAQVVLAHQGERLMERQLDAASAELLRRHLEELGVEVHTECRVRGLLTGPADERTSEAGGARTARPGGGHDSRPQAPATRTRPQGPRAVHAVQLADGHALDARLVVLACGVRPRTGLAEAAGLTVSRGVVVDDRLRTSDPRIHAVGDCAEHRGVLYGLAGPAQEQADALARVIADGSAAAAYGGTRSLTRLTLAGGEGARQPLDLAAFGDPLPREDDDVVSLTDATRGVHRKVVVRDDRLVGGILLGDLAAVGTLARTYETGETLPPEPLLHLLTHDGEALR